MRRRRLRRLFTAAAHSRRDMRRRRLANDVGKRGNDFLAAIEVRAEEARVDSSGATQVLAVRRIYVRAVTSVPTSYRHSEKHVKYVSEYIGDGQGRGAHANEHSFS